MEIQKIKLDSKKGVTIAYSVEEMNEGIILNCTDDPLPSFINAMNALVEDVASICHLDDKWTEEGKVAGVSIKHIEGDYGANITAQLKGSDGMVVVVNTPYISPDNMTNSIFTALKTLCEEAKKYINGDRETLQGDLFAETSELSLPHLSLERVH